jgi:CIC family chloride channel protein
VDDHKQLMGVVTLSDIERAQQMGMPYDTPVVKFATTENLVTVFLDDPVFVALRRMNVYDIGRLPVISREDGRYIGMVRRSDILKAYDIGLTRKSIDRHRQEHFNLRRVDDHAFIEIEVTPQAPMVGKTLAEFPYSGQCLLVSIRKQGMATIAHGTTRIEAGDIVTAYATINKHEEVRRQFTAPSELHDNKDKPTYKGM